MTQAPPKELPPGWLLAGSAPQDYGVSTSLDVRHSGQPSMEIYSTGESVDGFGTIMSRVDADNYRGKRVRFSAFVKSDSVLQWTGLWMRVDGSSEMLRFDNMNDRQITGTTDWKEYHVVLDVPQESTAVCYGLLMCGPGHVWLADSDFQSVSIDDYRSTDVNRSCGVRYQNDAPVNLDFKDGLNLDHEDPCLNGTPKGWFSQSSQRLNYEMQIEGGVAHIRVLNAENGNLNWFALFQSVSANSYLNKRVRLSGKIKCSDVTFHAVLWLRTDAGHKLAVTHDYMEGREPKGTKDFAYFECVIDVPPNSDNIYLGGQLQGNGSAWFKDFKLEVVPESVPTTGKSGSVESQ